MNAVETTIPAQADTSRNGQDDAKKELVLNSLEIKNFRAFRHLVVPKVGRVNLITGKNNVGKTTLLEALYLYGQRGSEAAVFNLLNSRDEDTMDLNTPDQKLNRAGLLYFSRKKITERVSAIIGAVEQDHYSLSIETRPEIFENGEVYSGFSTSFHYSENISTPMGSVRPYTLKTSIIPVAYRLDDFYSNVHFIQQETRNTAFIRALWENIALTSKEDELIRYIQILEPNTLRINVANKVLVRIEHFNKPLPMKALGAGMTRLFEIALGAVNTQNGLLLIDEVETGIHYSVLSDMWKLIFATARQLNIQVFATTHSWDCIEAFQKAATEDEESEGLLIRLQREQDGDITSTVIDEETLKIVTRSGIEVR